MISLLTCRNKRTPQAIRESVDRQVRGSGTSGNFLEILNHQLRSTYMAKTAVTAIFGNFGKDPLSLLEQWPVSRYDDASSLQLLAEGEAHDLPVRVLLGQDRPGRCIDYEIPTQTTTFRTGSINQCQ